ncbi:glutaredoxin [Candidatus Magnetoovum chiemensis]|nr:glutaredoxin [Candidatus Magnetoovum chiemensis]
MENVLFALSTCSACKKTRELLDRNNVKYILVEADTIDIDSRTKIMVKLKTYNPRETFPTFVSNSGEKVIVGYNAELYKKELNIE